MTVHKFPGRHRHDILKRHSLQVAFDSGSGARCISHRKDNPYPPETMPDQHKAWNSGWEKTDAIANPQPPKPSEVRDGG